MGLLQVKPPPSSAPKLQVKPPPQKPQPARQEPAVEPGIASPEPRRKKPTGATVDIQKTPPHSAEAEAGVISSIMTDCQRGKRDVIAEVSAKINENFFYVPANRTIYEMLMSLWRAGRPLDLISFTEFLRSKNVLDALGGAHYVTELQGYISKITNYAPLSAGNIEYYLSVLRDQFARREVIADASQLVRRAYEQEDDFADVVQRLSSRMSHIGTAVNGRFPQMQDTSEFFRRESPPLPPLVIQHCLHQGSKMLLAGNSKGRKTWALMDVAISVATGADWWGFHTRRGQVCYVNLEIQPQFFEERFKRICDTKKVQPEGGMLWHWPMRGHAKPMHQLIKDLLGFLQQHHFSLVIIDPIYKTLPPFRGSENDSAMITQLLNEVESITVETGAAVLFCSHFSKGNQSEKESMDRVSGSGAWARDPDSLLTMTQHQERDCFAVEGDLRNLAPLHKFVVKWDYPMFVRQEEMNPDQLRKRGRPSKQPQKLLDMLEKNGSGLEAKAIVAKMKSRGWGQSTTYRIIEQLEDEGLLKFENDLWNLTPKDSQNSQNT